MKGLHLARLGSLLHPVHTFPCYTPCGLIFLWAIPRAPAAPEEGSGKAEDSGAAMPSHSLHPPGRPDAKRGIMLEASEEL